MIKRILGLTLFIGLLSLLFGGGEEALGEGLIEADVDLEPDIDFDNIEDLYE